MYIYQNNYKKTQITLQLGIVSSIVIHGLFIVYLINDLKKSIDYNEVSIDSVEFYDKIQKKEIIKPKIIVEQKKIEQKNNIPETPRETMPEIIKTKIEIPEPTIERSKPKDLDIEPIKTEKKISIKDIDDEPILKNREHLDSEDVKKLITLEEVGEKKFSKKTLELANELQKNVKIKNFDKPQIELKDNEKIKDLDKKIANFNETPVINMSNKTFEKMKDIKTAEIKTEKNSNNFNLEKIVVLQDKNENSGQQRISKISSEYDSRQKPIKLLSKNSLEIEENKVKEIKVDQTRVVTNTTANQKDLNTNLNTKNFSITGAIKNRSIVYNVLPKYPDWAQEKNIDGVVSIYFEVLPNGKIIETSMKIEITSGYKKLDDYAISVLKNWLFSEIKNDEIQNGVISFLFRLK